MSNLQNKRHMAQNIYSNPQLSKTSGHFDGFSIDFTGIKTPLSTYWALCNWGMDLTSFKEEHPDAHGGGAYGGLQNTVIGRKAIMSFWETFYDADSKRHNARRIYPAGESTFGGEGEGTNNIVDFPWQTGKTYRMVLRSWTDAETGTTFVGQWFLEKETGKWSLISYFDTGFRNSCFVGRMSQFQENFWDRHSRYMRSFGIENIFVKDTRDGEWKYVERTALSYDDPAWGYHTGGTHEFGVKDGRFYGKTGGNVDDQASYDAARPLSAVYFLPQKEELVKGKAAKPKLKKDKDGFTLDLSGTKTSLPVIAFTVKVFDAKGKELFSKTSTRPDVTSLKLPNGEKAQVTLTDVYGATRTDELSF